MLSIVSALGMNAQTWTASEIGEGTFYLYNVGKKQFLTCGNGWGTQASVSLNSAMTVTIEAVGSDYKLRTDVNGSGKGLERLGDPVIYTDQSAGKNSTWTFTKVADASNGPIYTIVSKDNHGGGAGSYMTASADNTIVGPADAVTDDYGRWQLVQAWVTNSMPVSDASGWTTSLTPTFDGNQVCAEFWNKSGASIKQTVNNLPAGSYDLIAVAFTRTGMTATLNAGSNTMSIATASTDEANNRGQANTWFNNGNGVNTLAFTHAGGSLEIGLTADNANGDHWLVWRSFVLIYKGLDLSELKAALQAQIDAVSALQGTTTTAAYNAAKNYAESIDMDALTSEEEISAAATELSSFIDAAKTLQSAYANYNTIKAAVEALDDDATVFTGSAVDVSAADAAVEAATTAEGINAAIDQLRNAAGNFLSSVTLNEGKRFDITNIYLTNPDFEVPTANGVLPPGWNITITGQNCGQQNRTDTNPETSLAITNFIEAWHPSQLGNGVIAQTVSSLPEGTYVLECDASICHDPAGADDITGANLFVQSSLKKEVSDPISNVRLYIKHYDVTFSHGGSGSVTFGLEANNTNANWLSADNFKVYYAGGVDLSIYATSLAEAVADFEALESVSDATDYATYKAIVDENNKTWNNSAEYQAAIDAVHGATNDLKAANDARAALVAAKDELAKAVTAAAAVEGTVPAAAYAALDAVVTEQNKTYDTTDEYNDATSAINTAITAATALKPNYDAFKTLKASANALVAVDNDNNTANGELTNAISEANTAVEAATDADAIATTTTDLKAAMVTYAGAANPVGDGAQFDLTFMLTNPDLTNCTGWAPADGWYNDQNQPTQNSQVMNSNNAVANTADPSKFAFYEYWSSNTEATEGFTVYQKVTLPEGTYKMTALAVAGYGGGHRYGIGTDDGGQPGSVSSEDHKNITFSAGETDGTQITTTTLEDASIEFINDQTQEVKIGLKAHAGNTSNWMGIGYVQLFKVPAAAVVTIDENVDFTPVDVAANVELKRTFVADKWNTFVVPFAITNAELKAAFGDNVAVAEYSDGGESANAAAVNFNTMDTPSILANRPVLIKVETNATEFSFTGKTMAAAKFAPGTYYTFVGNYAANFQIPENNYFISGDKLWKSAGATTIKGTRAYLAVRNPNASTEVKLFIDGVETGINEIADNPVENGTIFNLAGQRVNKAQKGIFIINGKKVIK